MADPLSDVYLGRGNTGSAAFLPQEKETATDYFLRQQDEKRKAETLAKIAEAKAAAKDTGSKPHNVPIPDMFSGLLPGQQKRAIELYNNAKKATFPIAQGGLSGTELAMAYQKANEVLGQGLAETDRMKSDAQLWTSQYKDYLQNTNDYEDDAGDLFDKTANGEVPISQVPKPISAIDTYKAMQDDVKIDYPKTIKQIPLPQGGTQTTSFTTFDEPLTQSAFNTWFSTDNAKPRKLAKDITKAILTPGTKEYDPLFLTYSGEEQQKAVHDIAYEKFKVIKKSQIDKDNVNRVTNPGDGGSLVINGNGGGTNGRWNFDVDADGKYVYAPTSSADKTMEVSIGGKKQKVSGLFHISPDKSMAYFQTLPRPALDVYLPKQVEAFSKMTPQQLKDNHLYVDATKGWMIDSYIQPVVLDSRLITEINAATENKKGIGVVGDIKEKMKTAPKTPAKPTWNNPTPPAAQKKTGVAKNNTIGKKPTW